MPRENIDSFYRAVDAFNRRDWDAFVALTDDEIEVESRLVAMEGGYHGHEGLRRWRDDFLGAFPDYTIEVKETARPRRRDARSHSRMGTWRRQRDADRRSVLDTDEVAGRKVRLVA
jgi:hypothetical protein